MKQYKVYISIEGYDTDTNEFNEPVDPLSFGNDLFLYDLESTILVQQSIKQLGEFVFNLPQITVPEVIIEGISIQNAISILFMNDL